MASGSARHTSLGWLIATALVMGCGGDKPPPKSGDNWLDSLEQRKVEGPPPDIEVDEEEEEEEVEPKEPPKPAPEVKPPSGRPMIQMGPKSVIESTFGATPGAVLKLAGEGGNITLRIPEYALDRGYNIAWKIDKGQVRKGAVVGSVAYLKLTPGDKLKARADTAADKPFQVRVPLSGRASLNLAVGTLETDDQGNETGKPAWKVYPPVQIEEGFGEAHFELPAIGPVMYIHATTADTTESLPEG